MTSQHSFDLHFSLVAQWWRIHLQCRRHRRPGFDPWVGKIPWRKAWQLALVFLPGESQGQRSLVGYSPRGCKRAGHDLVTKQQQQLVMLSIFSEDKFLRDRGSLKLDSRKGKWGEKIWVSLYEALNSIWDKAILKLHLPSFQISSIMDPWGVSPAQERYVPFVETLRNASESLLVADIMSV